MPLIDVHITILQISTEIVGPYLFYFGTLFCLYLFMFTVYIYVN